MIKRSLVFMIVIGCSLFTIYAKTQIAIRFPPEKRMVREVFRYPGIVDLKKGRSASKVVVLGRVAANGRYRLVFDAVAKGADTVEKQDWLSKIRPSFGRSNRFPRWKLRFYKSEETRTRIWRSSRFFTCVLSESETKYQEEFYTPGGSTFAAVAFTNGSGCDSLFVRNIRLEKIDSNILNINWNFSMGINNYSGYSVFKSPDIILSNNAKLPMLDISKRWGAPGGSIRSELVPVSDSKRYRISFYAKGTFARVIGIMYGKGKKIDTTSGNLIIRSGRTEFRTYEFIPKKGTQYISLLVLTGLFHWVRLEEVGDAYPLRINSVRNDL